MKIIKKLREQPHQSGWYNEKVDYLDYYFVDGKGGHNHIRGVATTADGKEPIENVNNPYLVSDWKGGHENIEKLIKQLRSNGFKYLCYYCGAGCLGTPDKFINPFKFIKWIKENNYTFNDMLRIEKNKKSWSFGGNLTKVSCAFSFRIFEEATIVKIKKEIKDIKVIQLSITNV